MKTILLPWIEKMSDKIDWCHLSKNINAISMLENNLDKVNWIWLSNNINAIHIFEKNLDKVDWFYLSRSPIAIHLFEQNQDKIEWKVVSGNPNIFRCDYDYYKKRMDIHREELMKKVFHPRRLYIENIQSSNQINFFISFPPRCAYSTISSSKVNF